MSLEVQLTSNKHCKALDFSKKEIPILIKLGFSKISISEDLRDKSAEKRIYKKLSNILKKGDIVYITLPNTPHHIPIILTMIEGITGNLSHIVFFDSRVDPQKQNPMTLSLEDIKYKSTRAAKLQSEYI